MAEIAEKLGVRGRVYAKALKQAMEKAHIKDDEFFENALKALVVEDERLKASQPKAAKRSPTIPELKDLMESEKRDTRYKARQKLRTFSPEELELHGVDMSKLIIERHLGPKRAA